MKKIDIFVWMLKPDQRSGGYQYVCSTNKAKTCREAIENFKRANPEYVTKLTKAYYAK